MRSTCGKSSAKPVTVVDEHVISDLFIQICLDVWSFFALRDTAIHVASEQQLVIKPKLQHMVAVSVSKTAACVDSTD